MSLKAYMDGSTARRIAKRNPAPLPRLTAWPGKLADDEREERSDLPEQAPVDRDEHASPHWGNFWPAESVPELDEVCFEPCDGGYVVYSAYARILQRWRDQWRACGYLNRTPGAAFVCHNGTVIARKENSPARIGQAIDEAKATLEMEVQLTRKQNLQRALELAEATAAENVRVA